MVVDLHSDLLTYLAMSPYHLVYDEESRTSIQQMQAGKVKTQTLAIFTKTSSRSVAKGMKAVRSYQKLVSCYREYFSSRRNVLPNTKLLLLAFENASSFCSENEALTHGIRRLKKVVEAIEKPLYVSLTWKEENRFGGGDLSEVGLKEDGKRLVYALKPLVNCIDLSHASDKLAEDLFSFIDKEKLQIPLIASHSNFRAIQNVKRNLPSSIAREIVKRGGLVGLNVITTFVGDRIEALLDHVAFGVENGFSKHMVFGCDFFADCIGRGLSSASKYPFFDGFSDSSCYPKLIKLIQKRFGSEVAHDISSTNATSFIRSFQS